MARGIEAQFIHSHDPADWDSSLQEMGSNHSKGWARPLSQSKTSDRSGARGSSLRIFARFALIPGIQVSNAFSDGPVCYRDTRMHLAPYESQRSLTGAAVVANDKRLKSGTEGR